MPVVGPRFLIEAGFIIAVAVAAGVARLGTWWIILVVAGAWVVVALAELAFWARHAAARTARAGRAPRAEPERAAVVPPAVALPELRPEHAILPEPEPRAEPTALAEPKEAEVTATPVRPVADDEPAAEPEPEPARPELVAVPTPEPAAEPERPFEPEPEPEPEPERVVALTSRGGGPRQWNLWELERAVRASSGDDVVRDEERSYLLMYLREFAGADGILPADFDGLVRDAFGDLLHAVGT